MSGLEARFDELGAGLKGLPEKTENIRVDLAAVVKDVETLKETIDQHHKQSLLSLHTLGLRERMAELEAEIRQDASDLYDRLKAGEVYDAAKWAQWENVHSHWDSVLKAWVGLGRWYARDVTKRTMTVDDAKYGLDWTVKDEQFPHAEAVRRFKKFRIIFTQWEELLPEVHGGMKAVAFSGLSDTEVRSGNPAG